MATRILIFRDTVPCSTLSVLTNHLQAFSHPWQTPFPRASHSLWSIDLACEITRSHAPLQLIVGEHKNSCRESWSLLTA